MADPTESDLAKLAELLCGDVKPKPEAHKTAEWIVERGCNARLTNPSCAEFALRILRSMSAFREGKGVPSTQWVRSVAFALRLSGHTGNLQRFATDAAAFADSSGWTDSNTHGHRFFSARAAEVLGCHERGWNVTGLPAALQDLAAAIESLGGSATASQLAAATGRNPSDTLLKYPSWEEWIKRHIKRPKHGIYELE